MNWIRRFLLVLVVVTGSGCATIPPGPSVMAMPPSGKSFDAFRMDDADCRQWAESQVGLSANETVNQNLAGGAAIGTMLGAGLGALIGSAYGNVGAGAAIGAASGLAFGAAGASGPAYASGYEVQTRYDIAYQQCMVAKGNQFPGGVRETRRVYYMSPPPPVYGPWPPAVSPYYMYPPPPFY
jgi:hypothetical protein